jgi:hypothetical protein
MLSEDEAGDLLEDALSSLDPYPINLDWLVPLLHYKHISSLTTHLKRHFEKDVDYKKCSVGGGVRAYTYQITIKCFKMICTKARHASRKQVAIYWIKVIDKKAGGIETGDEETKRRKIIKKRSMPTPTGEGAQPSGLLAFEEDEDLDVEDDDEDDVDYSPYQQTRTISNIAATTSAPGLISNSLENDSDVELDNSSSAYLRSLRNQTTTSSTSMTSPLQTVSPFGAITLYGTLPTTAPPQPPRRRDFSNVGILARKRTSNDEPWTAKKEQKRVEDTRTKERISHTRNNLRMLSQLALGLR